MKPGTNRDAKRLGWSAEHAEQRRPPRSRQPSDASICTLYGKEFAGKIEVHHKKPLSEIREDYVVDPVNDLVPVCPNCHMVLHSKPGNEPYTVEEVRSMLDRCKPYRN